MPALPPTAPPPLHHPPNPWRLRLGNLWWEARLSVRTRGVIDVQHSDAYHYATMSYRTIFQVLDHLQLGPHDSFVDIGCGKGRVLCCAARQSLRRVVGVDLSAELVQQARANAQSLRGRRSAVEVH